jgi:hypothetical protein
MTPEDSESAAPVISLSLDPLVELLYSLFLVWVEGVPTVFLSKSIDFQSFSVSLLVKVDTKLKIELFIPNKRNRSNGDNTIPT